MAEYFVTVGWEDPNQPLKRIYKNDIIVSNSVEGSWSWIEGVKQDFFYEEDCPKSFVIMFYNKL